MGNLARALQHRFHETCPRGWRCTFEERIMSPGLERMLGFAPRADVLLTRDAVHMRDTIDEIPPCHA